MAELSLPRRQPPTPPTAPAAVPARPAADPRQRAWQTAWAPWWLGSDLPVPLLPTAERLPTGEVGMAGAAVLDHLRRVRRGIWLRHLAVPVVRGVWLGLALGCLWVVVDLLGGPAVRWPAVAGLVALLTLLGLGFGLANRPTLWETARMLDRTFALHERLTTALADLGRGVPGPGGPAGVAYLQTADAANAIELAAREKVLGPRLPVREAVLVLFCGLLLAALAFLRGVGGGLPPLGATEVPPFVPAVDRPADPAPQPLVGDQAKMAPTVDEVLAKSEDSNQAQRDLQSLADALRDHAVTRPAADALQQGNAAAAAAALRDLAPNADQLSPAAREELARDLQAAAQGMSQGQNPLRPATEQAAAGLRQGEQPAQQGISDLADAVEQTGRDIVPQQELASQMQQAQSVQASRRQAGGQQSDGQAQAQAAGNGQPQAGDPGQGAPAQAGEGQPGDASSQQGASGQQGRQGSSGRGGQPGPASQSGAGQQGQQGQPGQGGDGQKGNGSESGAPGEARTAGEQSGRGGGAGGEGSDQPKSGDQSAGGAAGGDQSQPPASGNAAEQQAAGGEGGSGKPGKSVPTSQTMVLPAGQGDQGMQTAADGGSAMRGGGTGVTAGAGSAVQGEVGAAGPDSNRVPADYRPVVEHYFSEGAP